MRKGFEPIYHLRRITDLRHMLYSGLQEYGDKTMFLEKDKQTESYGKISYSRYIGDVEALGTSLVSLGSRDTNIVVIGENRYAWAVSYMAVVNGVGTVVPVDKELPEHEIMNILERVRPYVVIYSGLKDSIMRSVAQKSDDVRYFIGMDLNHDEASGKFISYEKVMERGKALLAEGNREYLDSVIDPGAIRILLFTSATTSESKAVQLSHFNLVSNLMDMTSLIKLHVDDVFLSVLPLHHTYECTCGFLCPLYAGCAIAYCEGLKHIVDNMKESGATIMLGVPLLFESMHKKLWKKAEKAGSADKLRKGIKISNLLLKLGIDKRKELFRSIYEGLGGNIRLFISGAAAISPEVAKFFRSIGLSFFQGYGLTECSPILALNSDVEFEDASAGKALPNVEIQIWEPNQEGIGEIVAKGPNIMVGYLDAPELNEQAFEGGYFHTGDMGYMDDRGFVYITGRKKSVIVTKNGKNIYPEEIELLLNNSPYVSESMVYGVPSPMNDDLDIAASIFPDYEGFEAEFGEYAPELVAEKINGLVKEVNARMVNYKSIKKLTIRDTEFEKTTTRKIKRYVEDNKG
ncbi:MAG: AMP-binding protein [Clostridia bacterium]